MNMNISAGQSLASKLSTKGKKLRNIVEKTGTVPDIEDVGKVFPYFSPIRTRQQRKNKVNKPTTVKITNQVSKNVPENSKISQAVSESQIIDTVKIPIKMKESTVQRNKNVRTSSENWSPMYWSTVIENIRLMRHRNQAPVDSMGCHKCADSNADEKTQRFQKLVALMLSSQTKDETTFEAMKRLKERTLTPSSIVSMTSIELEKILHPVSFYKNKAKYIQETSLRLIDEYDSDIPRNIKELVSLPGVGPKMAHICMATAWNEITGIGVDVHVHRIANRLGWVKSTTKEPEQTRKALESWLPRELWAEVNHLLVGFGQTICTPVKPNCDKCCNIMCCPYAEKNGKVTIATKFRDGLCPAVEFEQKLMHI